MKHKLRFYTKNKLQKISLFVLLIFLNNTNAQINWQKLDGPLSPATPYSFLITSDGTQFVGADGRYEVEEKDAGLFRSTNNGNTWELKNSGINSYIITCLAEAPNGDIYAGTKYGFMSGTIGCLYKSTNNGDTWELMINSDSQVYDIKFNSLGYVLVGSQYGMYISTDNGITWSLRNNGLRNYNVLSILPTSNTEIIVATNDGVHYTINNGLNWIPINNGLIKWGDYYKTNKLVLNNDTLYVSCWNGLYYSTNFGQNWVNKSQLKWITNLEIGDNNVFYLNHNHKDLLRSLDCGLTWDTIYTFPEYSFFYTIKSNKIFAGVWGVGLMTSTDGGQTFSTYFSEPYIPTDISCIKIVDKEKLYAGTYDHGLFLSTDLGETWKQLGPENSTIYDLIFNAEGNVFVNCNYKLYKSYDDGRNWEVIEHPLYTDDVLRGLQLSANNRVYSIYQKGGNSCISRLNEDALWDSLYTFLGPGYGYCNVYNLFIDKYDDAYLSVFYNEYNTGYWTRTYKEFGDFTSFNIIFNGGSYVESDDSGIVYLGYSKMYKTTDRGGTYLEINNGITNLQTYDLKSIDGKEIYIGDYKSLYLSTNQGDYWHSIPGPPSANGIHSIEKIGSGSLLIASKNGIYKNLNPVYVDDFDVKQIISYSYSLQQNYPNPFNPSTIISWQSPVGGWQTLKVFDVLGNEVATLVNEYRSAGSYEIEFDPASSIKNPASGIYFYQLKAGEFVETKKMLLLK